MRRDFTKSNAMKRSWHHRFGFMSLLGIMVAMFLCAIVLFGVMNKHWQTSAYIVEYTARIRTWLSEHKHHLNPTITKTKQMAANKVDTEMREQEPIHFEFYTALPNMQVSVSDAMNRSASSLFKSTPEKSVLTATKPAAKTLTSNPFINADEIEKEFAHEIKQETYIVQVGSFHSVNAAEHQRKVLIEAGFSASTIKTETGGKLIYRVALGPFANKNQTKVVQQRLHKKGFSGIVRKIEIA